MDTLIADLPKTRQIRDGVVDPGEPASVLTEAEDRALRAIRAVLFQLDGMRALGGLRRVQAPSGDFLWVCADHFTEYDPGLPRVP